MSMMFISVQGQIYDPYLHCVDDEVESDPKETPVNPREVPVDFYADPVNYAAPQFKPDREPWPDPHSNL